MFRRKSSAAQPASAPQPVVTQPSQGSLNEDPGSVMGSTQDMSGPSADPFWNINQYKRIIKRMEYGIDSCENIQSMLKERAAVELLYAQNLTKWADKWTKNFEKKPEFGSLATGYQAMITEARQCSNVHTTINSNLIGLADTELPKYKKENYTKELIGYKEVKQAEKGFGKATKPYAKLHANMISAKKSYHNACSLRHKAEIAAQAGLSADHTTDEARKLQDKAAKSSRDADDARFKYVESIQALNNDQPRYINEMTEQYNKCQDIENHRIAKMREVTIKSADILDVTQVSNFNEIFATQHAVLENISPEQDAESYARLHGTNMDPKWPAFEEYDAAREGLRPSINYQQPPTMQDNNRDMAQSFDGVNDGHHYQEHEQAQEQDYGHQSYDNHGGGYAAQRQARALYSYDAQGDDELTFNEGDVIIVLEEADASGWAKGEVNGRQGMLPANYID